MSMTKEEMIEKVESVESQLTLKNQETETLKTEVQELKDKENVSKEDFEKLQTKFDVTIEEVSKLKEGEESKVKFESIEDQLSSVIKNNTDRIKSACEGGKGSEFSFKIKTGVNNVNKTLASTASVSGNTRALYLDGIGMFANRKLGLMDAVREMRIDPDGSHSSIRYWDWDESQRVLNAAAIAEGAAFPEDAIGFIEQTIPIRKIGTTIPITEELMSDASMFADQIQKSLDISVKLAIEQGMYNGPGTGVTLTGFLASISAYTAGTDRVQAANIFDLLVKIRSRITVTAGSKYSPMTALMNISDIDSLVLAKDDENRYLFPELKNMGGGMYSLGTLMILEANVVTANTLIFGDMGFSELHRTNEAMVTVGMVNNQFNEDEMTVKVRERMAFIIRFADAGGFRHVASITAELATLVS